MRGTPALTAVALTAVGAAVLAGAPTAVAQTQSLPNVVITPSTARPGETVSVVLTCPLEAIAEADGEATFNGVVDPVHFGPADENVFTGTLTVPTAAQPGRYSITSECTGGRGESRQFDASAVLTVTDRLPSGGAATGDGSSQGGARSAGLAPRSVGLLTGLLCALATAGSLRWFAERRRRAVARSR